MNRYLNQLGFIIAIILCLSAGRVGAQPQSPSDFLGYELGSRWTPHYKVMDYVRHVADNSPLVEVRKYGETNEDRDLYLAYISTENNMGRLEQIRTNNLKRTGLIEGEPSSEKTAIVWFSYNVHGNEASSSEAAMKTLYELARPGNTKTKRWLEDVVVIIDPMLNPDGRDRYTQWYRQTAGADPNVHPDAREHHEPWPGGRTNHYYFDLNRDWAWLTQKESRARLAEYQRWMPHIHVDFHEQYYRNPYYFAPAAEPYHNAITDWQRDFQHTIGKNNAKYFDENNWLYFTREVFDLFYPSYGDTYPIFNGAIGMTYEQAGHSRAGLGILKVEGDTLTLNDRLSHHVVTGLSTVEVSARNAGEIVDEFEEYYEQTTREPAGKYKTYVFKADNNPDKLQALFNLLDRHRIEYGKASGSRTLDGYNYRTGDIERVDVAEGDYLVSTYQPKSVLTRVLFEPRPELSDSVTYDITAWEQHYAFGLDGYALSRQLDMEPASFTRQPVDNAAAGAPYAYVAKWQGLADVRMLGDLLQEGINVRFSQKEFTFSDQEYPAGTLIITRSDNETKQEEFDRLVQEVGDRYDRQLVPTSTGFAQSGVDFGSSSVRYIKKPRVALLSGRGTSSNRVGEVWHFFDQQINYPLTMLDTRYFKNVNLHAFDVLILPGGDYHTILKRNQLKKLKEWISAGGRLIALGGANRFFAGKEGFSLARKEVETDSLAQPSVQSFDERQHRQMSNFNTGSVYEIAMDTSHPLAFGYEDSYYSLKLNADAFHYLEDGWNVGVTKEKAHMSGFIGYKAKKKLENTLTFGMQNMGTGSVIYMIDNPLFRGFWHNGKLLMANAIFLAGN